jgi:nitrile hydratase
MDGVHDMGGLQGFGAIRPEPEAEEPLFHEPWEARALGLVLASGALGQWSLDRSRHARESLPPAVYLTDSYYELWLDGLARLLVEAGVVGEDELAAGRAAGPADPALTARRLDPAVVPEVLARGGPATLASETPARFAAGDRVRVAVRHPRGHSRAPRYVRGRAGTVIRVHGGHVLPDASAEGRRVGETLYTVRFDAAELWGPDADGPGAVHLDLWDRYLEPA